MSAAPRSFPPELGYAGLKMTADEFFALGETRERYELVDGVVVMSPSPTPSQNELLLEIALQLRHYADQSRQARVFIETDVRFRRDKVYCPDISLYRADRLAPKIARLELPPDLIVEILSPGTKALDLITKRDDYLAMGVQEYWIVDPSPSIASPAAASPAQGLEIRCWQPRAESSGRAGSGFAESRPQGDTLASTAFAGLMLDLRRLRAIAEL